ncbi:N-acetylglucosamine kinase [Sciscionella marina]|uniref:N-acetylglucosamine kinase n=1 Tax=Sciscionella marina TaxID=508770 RepID=UPI00037C4EC1|nr:BadF/BadG/BcrA/BcrD ATPase family protein [Sciscionella marina]
MPFALGMDIGGTRTRAALLDESGTVRGTGTAAGANPVSAGVPASAARIGEAAGRALDGHRGADVRAVLLGMAGGHVLVGTFEAIGAALRGIGIAVVPRHIGDVALAFAAGTGEPDGCALIAGTGAIAGRIRNRCAVRYADGHGWALGDRGSGVWLGRHAVQHALDALDNDRPDELAERVYTALGARDREAIYAVVYADLPGSLARLAPLVLDRTVPAACAILDEAAAQLLATATLVREHETEPLVLAGGLLTGNGPLAERVHALAGERWARVHRAGDGAETAARLALREISCAEGSELRG